RTARRQLRALRAVSFPHGSVGGLAGRPKNDFPLHWVGFARHLGRKKHYPTSFHGERCLEGEYAGLRTWRRSNRRTHLMSLIGGHLDASIDDYRVRNRLISGPLEETHGKYGHVASLDLRLDSFEHIVISPCKGITGQSHDHYKSGAGEYKFP